MTLLSDVFVLLGSAFGLIAALGVLRFPDLMTRMHAATKAGTLGAGLLLAAVALAFADASVTARVLATLAFLLLTAPVASHVLGRAAYRSGLRPWLPTGIDDLRDADVRDAPAS